MVKNNLALYKYTNNTFFGHIKSKIGQMNSFKTLFIKKVYKIKYIYMVI